VRYRFIEQERRSYPVGRLCGVMQVSRSGFYVSRRRSKSDRAQQDEVLTRQIQRIHRQNRRIYGAPRIHAELCDQQVRCGRKRVARLMRLVELKGKVEGDKNPKRSPPALPVATNLLTHSVVTRPIKSGSPTSPICVPVRAGFISLLSSTPTPDVSWGGLCASVPQPH
jgi:putative transposase